jgi:hypothetical protein
MRALLATIVAASFSSACVSPDRYYRGNEAAGADAAGTPDLGAPAAADATRADLASAGADVGRPDSARPEIASAMDAARDPGRADAAPPPDGAAACMAEPSLDGIICAPSTHFYFCPVGAAPPGAACVLRSDPGSNAPAYCCP